MYNTELLNLLKRAVRDNNHQVILYILDYNDLLSYQAFSYAADIGNVNLMKQIFSNFNLVMLNTEFFRSELKKASINGVYDVVDYLNKLLGAFKVTGC